MEDRTPAGIRIKLRATLVRALDRLEEDVRKHKYMQRVTSDEHVLLKRFLKMSTKCYENTLEEFAWFMHDYFGDDPERVSVKDAAREIARNALYEAAESTRRE